MADLTTLANVKRQLGLIKNIGGTLTDNTDDDTLIADYVTEATALFEGDVLRRTNATFIAAPGTILADASAPFVFGRKLFFLQPVIGVYSVINGDGTAIASSDYRLLPTNDPPYYALEIKRGTGLAWTYTTSPEEAITIAGTLGYVSASAVPADVTLAVTKLAAHLYMNRDNRGEIIRFADGSSQIPADAPGIIFRVIQRYAQVRVYA